MIDIKLEGARKVITVHSALTVVNELSLPVELMASLNSKEHSMCVLPSKGSFHVPVQLLKGQLFVRPLKENTDFEFSEDDLCWREAAAVEERNFGRRCKTNAAFQPYYQ